MTQKILFICKKNENYSSFSYGKRSGLYNSTRFIVESLIKEGIGAEVVEVVDNNDIDREVTKYRPEIVVIEALWVVPEKFDVLKKLHPNVKWFVHLHSNIPFLATEGIAVQWIKAYEQNGVGIIVNSDAALEAIKLVVQKNLYLLHNVYLGQFRAVKRHQGDVFSVGCFGAIRPMKNQLTQALAALKFAKDNHLKLRFHINPTRSEGGDSVLKNLRALFTNISDAQLIEIPWLEHPTFLDFLHMNIDMSMQVSLSETYNICTADAVAMGLPVVTSSEVKWVSGFSQADADSVDDIAATMLDAYNSWFLVKINQISLRKVSKNAKKEWLRFVNKV